MNFDKSALTFSPSTSTHTISEIANLLSIEVVMRHNIYLGLPNFSLRNKKLQFVYLLERVEKKTKGWNAKYFSKGGREVLIKSVLQVIPSYAMSCFKVPAIICQRVEKFVRIFGGMTTLVKQGCIG